MNISWALSLSSTHHTHTHPQTHAVAKQHDNSPHFGLLSCEASHCRAARSPFLPSLIASPPCVIHFAPSEAGGATGRGPFVLPVFHYAARDCAEAIEVMTWVLHLENHFHIPQQRVVMIAFDKRQSKLHHLFPECSSVQTSWGEEGRRGARRRRLRLREADAG